MGNEMGNNNTTGLKEEENLKVEDPKGLLSKEIDSSVGDVKQESNAAPDLESKDFHERGEDISVDKKELPKAESGDFPLDDSPEVEAGTKEESSESSDNQQAAFTNEAEDESLIELNMDVIVPNQLEAQAFSVKKEDEEMTNSYVEPIPEKPAHSDNDQHELATFQAEVSLPDATGSSGGTEKVSGSISAPASTENGHPETKVLDHLEVEVDTESSDISEKNIDESIVEQKKEAEKENMLTEDHILEDGLSNVTTQSDFLTSLSGKTDEGSSIEVSLIGDESSESAHEIISATNSPNSHQEVNGSENKVLVYELEKEQDKHELNQPQPCEELVRESETEDSDEFQSDSISTVEQRDAVNPFTDFESDKDCLLEEAKVSEDREDNAVISLRIETVPPESKIADCRDKEAAEKRIVEEIEPLYAIEIDRQELVLSSEMVQEPKKDGSGESNFDSKILIHKMIVSMNELALDRTNHDVNQCPEKPEVTASETKLSSRESVERFSTDSDRDSIQYAQMRKSPSFSVDLQNEASNEESEKTPLLYQDKAEIQSSPSCLNDVSDQAQAMTVEEKVVTLERSDSEKSKTPFLGFLKEEEESQVVVTPTKQGKSSATAKEAKNVVSSSITVSISSTSSSKGKEKRKARSSLFGNCMCCATVIN